MRNPDRLDNFYGEMKKFHKQYFPDWRFGQLISNFFGWVFNTYNIDTFFIEEDRMIEWFKIFCQENGEPALKEN